VGYCRNTSLNEFNIQGGLTGPEPPTPSFVIYETHLLKNLRRIGTLREQSGAKVLLALKCFSAWGVFEIMRPFLDGTASSSGYEARLGYETFGGETHVYSVGFSAEDVKAIDGIADKIIFNSVSQYRAHAGRLRQCRSVGLRINPEVSYAHQTLADPARRRSRLGVRKADLDPALFEGIEGAMFHFNCENKDFESFHRMLDRISAEFSAVLDRIRWVSLGGGVLFTADEYPLERFAQALREFATRHSVQIYLEPGEAVVSKTTDLVVTVLDIVTNDGQTAIVDSATETHRLDTLIFNEPASIREADPDGPYSYTIGASSCLAGDVFCEARFREPLRAGDRLHILDSGGYTLVKLNWFNGLRMPSLYCARADGSLDLLNEFRFEDFKRMQGLRAAARPSGGTGGVR
jgi:carboxynorspermidine decarboxylase